MPTLPPLDVSLKYMEIFFSGHGMERLYDYLHDDCQFAGPLYQFSSACDYIESLQVSPPVNCQYKIIQSFEKGPYVNFIYEFSKPGVSTTMSQLFEVDSGKITRILLIFDSAALN